MPSGKFIMSLNGQTLKMHLSGHEVKASWIPADVLSSAWRGFTESQEALGNLAWINPTPVLEMQP